MILADGGICRLHQEDFCQALGIAPEQKYASEGGPTFTPCFELVRRACIQPAPAILRLLDAAIFNVAVGNADAHGKNYSLLYRPAGQEGVGLAPLYDLLCTAAYPEIHAKLAMKVGKRATLEEFTPTTWEDFAREIGMGAAFVRRRAAVLTELILARLDDVADGISHAGFDSADLHRFVDVIRLRTQTLLDLGLVKPRNSGA
jgi:serine/threonine-protein kinase HipA